MRIPFSGPFNMLHAGGGIVLGIIINIAAVQFTLSHYNGNLIGPAVKAEDVADACRLPMLATVGWCLVYWNMIGANVCCIFGINAFEAIPKDKVNLPDFTNVAGRFAGNSAEHAAVFLAATWMGAMFVDASSAGVLGCCYVVQRIIYPWVYMVQGAFTMKFEYCTQMGYGFIGQMLLGCVVQGFGGDWVDWVRQGPIRVAIYGFLFGSLALFPALPLGGPYAAIHYWMHRALHFKESTGEEQERLRS
mmetsp:Transcript_25068/g.50846  ORF Transcript_25068/g.50846 Transcript_25068/m.50846 type:complete len:247 (-) Transcript_25068:323-1063(-)|eukprot:CAMPEP_0113819224 /NCGR_PEP_ID=MMETSP0328-20130328/633_1 /TAXON_ID=39455 /ORGANISM="Alexandrium minutum" /LENGTH=246 /DNA_ID=CAMNT_0000787159 /DNA_START=85 /DNA_END=825 /DNA_ORIENTATION=- /assembly_acc=CAM_ASM_000350